jgi:SAM-dependent methyltransferase
MNVPYIHEEAVHNNVAATEVLPIVFDIFKPASIIDVGCGLGTWIQVAKTLGVNEVTGVDGAYVNRSLLKITADEFVEKDLKETFNLNRKYDMAICLEVAEHLPESSADNLINSLTTHADVVIFSAALPGQMGQNHLNEQWPQYWQKLFEKYGFEMIDALRPKIWDNDKVEMWYKQNMFLVVKNNHPLATGSKAAMMSLIHPDLFKFHNDRLARKMSNLQNVISRLQKRDLIGKVYKLFKK